MRNDAASVRLMRAGVENPFIRIILVIRFSLGETNFFPLSTVGAEC
jgi:hypothetical protein